MRSKRRIGIGSVGRFLGRNWILVATVAVALVLRVWGIGFGLPYRYHIDEQFYVPWSLRLANGQLHMPPLTHGPNLYMFLLVIQDGLAFVWLLLMGEVRSIGQFASAYAADPSPIYLAARSLSALAGTATVVAVYWIGRRVWRTEIGLLASVMLALSFLHVRQSHYAVPDTLMTLCLSLAMLAIVEASKTERAQKFMLAGLLIGLAMGIKLTAVVAALCLAVACFVPVWGRLQQERRSRWILIRNLLLSGTAVGIGFVLSYPVLVLSPQTFLKDLQIQSNWARQGIPPWQLDRYPAFLFYPAVLLTYAGVLPFGLFLVGMAREIWRGSSQSRLIVLFVLVNYLFLGSTKYYFVRFVLPILPFFALLAACGLAYLSQRAQAWWAAMPRRLSQPAVHIAIICLIMLPSLLNSIRFDWLLTQVDTRTRAKDWIEAHIAGGSKIAVDWPPPLATAEKPVPYARYTYDVTVLNGMGLATRDVAWYAGNGFEYLITSSFISDLQLQSEQRAAARQEFYAALEKEWELVQVFSPYQDAREQRQWLAAFDEIYGPLHGLWQRSAPGPIIKIYRMPERLWDDEDAQAQSK